MYKVRISALRSYKVQTSDWESVMFDILSSCPFILFVPECFVINYEKLCTCLSFYTFWCHVMSSQILLSKVRSQRKSLSLEMYPFPLYPIVRILSEKEKIWVSPSIFMFYCPVYKYFKFSILRVILFLFLLRHN